MLWWRKVVTRGSPWCLLWRHARHLDLVQLQLLWNILNTFSATTDLHINYDKSTFVPIGVPEEEVALLAADFGYAPVSFPQTYLGLPLSIGKMHLSNSLPLVRAARAMFPAGAVHYSPRAGKPLSPMLSKARGLSTPWVLCSSSMAPSEPST